LTLIQKVLLYFFEPSQQKSWKKFISCNSLLPVSTVIEPIDDEMTTKILHANANVNKSKMFSSNAQAANDVFSD
jgi:hypothetical protein